MRQSATPLSAGRSSTKLQRTSFYLSLSGLRNFSLVQHIGALQILLRLASANQTKRVAFDEHFGRAITRIVIRGERHSVSAGAPNRQQVPRLDFAQRPIVQKTISGLANRANNVCSLLLGLPFFSVAGHFCDRMDCAIEG